MTTATPFLQQLVDDLTSSGVRDFSEKLVVFPNRRAGLFFKRALSRNLDGPVWAPEVKSIQDFIANSAPLVIPSKINLLMELYQAYCDLGIQESFDTFYGWAEVLLSDFDELDKYQVDGSVLFKEILDVKAIEEAFGSDETQSAALTQFWQSVNGRREDKGIGQAFLEIWRTNKAVYEQFRDRLWQRGWGYEGMAYRLLAEQPESGTYGEWEQVIFAGFNALSPSEVAIIQYWQSQERASIYWDADPYYLDNHHQEAGKFLRNHFRETFNRPGEPWIQNHLSNSNKTIAEYGVPLNIGQAKTVGQLLDENAEGIIPERTAVILPDEQMLFPVLNSLPDVFTDVNVTMGYPLRNTPFYSLFQNLIKMQREASGSSSEKQFYYQEVLCVLRHPYIYQMAPETIYQQEQQILRGNEIFIPASRLKALGNETADSETFSELFRSVENVSEAFNYFRSLLLKLQAQLENEQMPNSRVEQEYLYHFHALLKQLTEALNKYEVGLTLETFWRLFSQMIQKEQLPFNGEPLKGLQVMGLLETRNLDFDHLYILSANEGQMPPDDQKQTFIPHSMRKAFGLPTQEDNSAVFAYHFYRLLQRAETITFLYDTEAASLDKGEQSRYLAQLKMELKRVNPHITYQTQLLNQPLDHSEIEPITIEKNEGVWANLTRFLGSEKQPPVKSLSPSAMLSYLACPLQFYFQYVIGLQEAETVREDVEPDIMGNIFHTAAAELYEFYINNNGYEVTKEGLETLFPKIEEYVDKAFQATFTDNLANIQGTNQLVRDVVIRQLQSVIRHDQKRTPFHLSDLENSNYRVKLNFDTYGYTHHVYLKGIIDRLEQEDGVARILDYKTGSVNGQLNTDIDNFFENSEKHKPAFQLLWYAYLYNQTMGDKALETYAAVYPVKSLNQELKYLKAGSSFEQNDWEQFEAKLRETFKVLFDPQVPFTQTTDRNTCQHCPFNPICYRQES